MDRGPSVLNHQAEMGQALRNRLQKPLCVLCCRASTAEDIAKHAQMDRNVAARPKKCSTSKKMQHVQGVTTLNVKLLYRTDYSANTEVSTSVPVQRRQAAMPKKPPKAGRFLANEENSTVPLLRPYQTPLPLVPPHRSEGSIERTQRTQRTRSAEAQKRRD